MSLRACSPVPLLEGGIPLPQRGDTEAQRGPGPHPVDACRGHILKCAWWPLSCVVRRGPCGHLWLGEGWEGITESHSSGTEQDTGEAKATRKRLSWGQSLPGRDRGQSCSPAAHPPLMPQTPFRGAREAKAWRGSGSGLEALATLSQSPPASRSALPLAAEPLQPGRNTTPGRPRGGFLQGQVG